MLHRLQSPFIDIPSSMMVDSSRRFHEDQIGLAMHQLVRCIKQRSFVNPWHMAESIEPDLRLVSKTTYHHKMRNIIPWFSIFIVSSVLHDSKDLVDSQIFKILCTLYDRSTIVEWSPLRLCPRDWFPAPWLRAAPVTGTWGFWGNGLVLVNEK